MIASVICMATVLYLEARGEGQYGMELVADVIMTRSERLDLPVCDVVSQPYQFAYNKNLNPREEDAWRNALVIALMSNFRDNETIDYFHTTNVNPRWGFTEVLRHGHHVFYDSEA